MTIKKEIPRNAGMGRVGTFILSVCGVLIVIGIVRRTVQFATWAGGWGVSIGEYVGIG